MTGILLAPQPSIETGRSVGNQAPCKSRSGIATRTSKVTGRRGYQCTPWLVRIDDDDTRDRARVQPRCVAAAIGVKDEPDIADQVLLEREGMMQPHGDPARTRLRVRKAKPVRREPQFADRPTENANRRAAAAAVDRSGFTATAVDLRAEAASRKCILSLCQHHCTSAGILPERG
jgi:hypothetical protein